MDVTKDGKHLAAGKGGKNHIWKIVEDKLEVIVGLSSNSNISLF